MLDHKIRGRYRALTAGGWKMNGRRRPTLTLFTGAAVAMFVIGAPWTPAAAQEPVPGAEVAAAVDRFARATSQERAMA